MLHRVALVLQQKAVVLPAPLRRTLRRVARRAVGGGAEPEDWSTPLVGPARVAPMPPSADPHPRDPTSGVPAGAGPIGRPTSGPDSCLLATGSLDVGGMDAFVDFLARGARERGTRVSVVVAADRPAEAAGRFAAALQADGLEVLLAAPDDVEGLFRGREWGCVSAHGAPDWLVSAAHARRIPVVETLHGMHDLYDRERLAARAGRLTAIVAVSDSVRRQYLSWVPGFDAERIFVVPNGVPSHARPPGVRESTRAALGLDGEFVLVSLGRYCLQKNQYALLAAFDEVAARVGDAHLVCAGRMDDSAYFAQVAERRRRSPYADRIHLRQHAPDPAALLAASDAFVLDSFFEGWSLASTEALTAGLPVVLAEVGGAVEQVAWERPPGVVVDNPLGDPLGVTWDGIAAARFRPQPNADALADAMVALAEDRAAWAGRREEIAHEAGTRFSPQACLEEHLALLARSVATARDGSPSQP